MRILKYFNILTFLFALSALPARAQFVGYTSPQTVQQTLAPALTACTGVAQIFPVQNLGQTQHYASIALTNANTFLNMKIQGKDATGNTFTISDVVFGAGTAGANANPSVTGSGYFPITQVVVTCSGGTFTLNYSGASSTPNVIAGVILENQIDKPIFSGAAENASQPSGLFVPPFGTTSGTLVFQYTTAAIAGSTLNVVCVANGVNTTYSPQTFPLANNTTIQVFRVAPLDCGLIQITYTTGGGGAGFASLDYLFDPQGSPPQIGCPTVVPLTVGAAGTVQIVAPVAGTKVRVCAMVMVESVAGTMQLTEGTGATCGTGTTNVTGAMTGIQGTPVTFAMAGSSVIQTNVAGDGLCIVNGAATVSAGFAQIEQH